MKSRLLFGLIAFIFFIQHCMAGYRLQGIILDQSTGYTIPDANILIPETGQGMASRQGGFFTFQLSPGKYTLDIRVIGYESSRQTFVISGDLFLTIPLKPVPVQLNPIVITAALSEHLKSNISAAATVYTQKEMMSLNGNTAGEILETTPGIYFRSYDGITGNQIPSIRGSNTDQVVVLLDGIRLNTAQGGGVDLNSFSLLGLERIEVIRGGHSSILGSDAVGGAVHLISREQRDKIKYGVSSLFGSFNTRTESFFTSGAYGPLALFLTCTETRSDGNFTFKTADTDEILTRQNNDYQGRNIFLKSSLRFRPMLEIQFIYHLLNDEKGIAGSVNINPWTSSRNLTPGARAKLNQRLTAVSFTHQTAKHFYFKEQFYRKTHDYEYRDPDGYSPMRDLHENRALGFQAEGQWIANESIRLTTGLHLRQESLKSTAIDADNRYLQALFGQWEIQSQIKGLNVILLPAIRHENYSDVGSHISPKIGLVMKPKNPAFNFQLKLNWDESFRVPTFNDLYWPSDDWTRGNPDLLPESSQNLDAGIACSTESMWNFQIELTWFHKDIKDLIQWGADETGLWTPQNIGQSRIQGLETGIKLYPLDNHLQLAFFHTWLKATNETPSDPLRGHRLIYRPDHKLDLLITSEIKRYFTGLNLRYMTSSYIQENNLSTERLNGYFVLNGNMGGHLPVMNMQLVIKLQLFNLLDKSYYVNDGYPMPGREYRINFALEY